MKIFKKIWKLLNESKFVLIVVGFLLTSVVGSFLTHRFQTTSWEREKRFEILRRRLNYAEEFLDGLSELINKRFIGLQRIMWDLEKKKVNLARSKWNEYYEVVLEWNRTLNTNRNKIVRLIGEEEGSLFLDYADERYPDKPRCLHGYFRLTHTRVLKALRTFEKNNKDMSRDLKKAQEALRALDIMSDNYIDMINTRFLNRAKELENF